MHYSTYKIIISSHRNILDKKISATFNKWRATFIKIQATSPDDSFEANKITVDVGCVHMLTYHARV